MVIMPNVENFVFKGENKRHPFDKLEPFKKYKCTGTYNISNISVEGTTQIYVDCGKKAIWENIQFIILYQYSDTHITVSKYCLFLVFVIVLHLTYNKQWGRRCWCISVFQHILGVKVETNVKKNDSTSLTLENTSSSRRCSNLTFDLDTTCRNDNKEYSKW